MASIHDNKLFFSDEKKYRIRRHLLFWGFWGFYFGIVRVLNPRYLIERGHFPDFFLEMARSYILLIPQAVLVYPLLYFILPRYVFNGKYIKASLWFVVFLLLTYTVSAAFYIALPWLQVIWTNFKLFSKGSISAKIGLAYLASMQGALTGAGLAASFKMFKHYYLKNLRNQQLQKENIESQLRLLRAQVHPHFLFNTLNNIYSQTQLESPKGSKMIMGLSDILRYILYEGQKPVVPLKQELMMITEYINLEKIRYGNKLDVHVLVPDKTEDICIAPLLLLPFVENCFKHGTSNVLEDPWINLTIELNDTILVMKLMNGKAQLKDNIQGKSGIGINNVRQRLDLLYNGKHDLQIREEDDVFVVDLKVELVRIKNKELSDLNSQPKPNVAYA
jgi:sensor histidine kinase YesM